jgi:hypothetical protein
VRDSRLNKIVGAYGGAIHCSVGSVEDCAGVEVYGSRLINNEADSLGGGIYSDASLLISHSELDGNSSGFEGGAIFVGSSGALTLLESQVSDNESMLGGAVFADGEVTVRKSALIGNAAATCGGAMHVYAGATVVNSTLASNSTGNCGGAIAGADVTISFSTLVDNDSASDNGDELYGATFTLERSLLTHPTISLPAAGLGRVCNVSALSVLEIVSDADGTDCGFPLNPPDNASMAPISSYAFGDLPQFYAITSSVNPVVDAASACIGPLGGTLALDQANNARPNGGSCDVGAFEFQ